MNKSQVWAEALNIMENYPTLPKKFKAELAELLEPKAKVASNPPQYNPATGEIIAYWCKFHERYEPISHMVISNGKSKGHCKASNAKWMQAGAKIKRLEGSLVDYITADDFKGLKAKSEEIKTMKEARNNPESFNFKEDWLSFISNNPNYELSEELEALLIEDSDEDDITIKEVE